MRKIIYFFVAPALWILLYLSMSTSGGLADPSYDYYLLNCFSGVQGYLGLVFAFWMVLGLAAEASILLYARDVLMQTEKES